MRQATKAGIALAAAAAALGGATAAIGTAHSGRAVAPPRPNIVVLETDDQTLESMKVMPQTKQLLGDEGVTFDNNFVSYSLCCPSRSTFLTGQYAHNHGVLGNAPPNGGYYKLDSTNTLPVWLQRAGYNTIHLGKYLNGYGTRDPTEVPPGWSEWHGGVDPTTYRYYNYTLNEDGKPTTYCAKAQAACYQTDVYAQKAQEIIQRRSAQTQPYFLWVAFLAPHAGAPRDPDDPANLGTPSPAPRHRNAFASMPLPQPPSFNEADVSDKPAGIRRRPLLGTKRIAAIRENYQQRLESLLAVDEAVQKIVDTLRATGTLDRTLIIFTSDNGFFHGEHRVEAGKVLLYEPSVRVPLIVRGPGIPKGVHRSQLVANIDLAPTIVDAANASPGRVMDGRSLFPLLHDGGKEYGRDILLENGPGAAQYSAVRSMDYLYAEYTNGDRELYDLAKDPDELQSLHNDPRYAQIRTELARRLANLRTCKGGGCRVRVAATFTVSSKKHGAGGCLRAPLTLRVTGSRLTGVSFTLRGRTAGADSRAPFRVVVPKARVPRGRSLARARVSAFGDRLVTLDRAIRVC
jgi:N-acetylglucosamine-6-sulfatase